MAVIILLEPIRNLGKVGDVVTVRNGFARNYLLPRKMALRANENNLRFFQSNRDTLEGQAHKKFLRAKEQADRLRDITVLVVSAASSSGSLYGSVTPRIIARSAAEQGYNLDAGSIDADPIRTTGIHFVRVRLHPEITFELRLAIGGSTYQAQSLVAGTTETEERRETALFRLDSLAATLASNSDFDAANELLEIVSLVDSDRGDVARDAIARRSGPQFEDVVRSTLKDLNIDCLVGVDAAVDRHEQRFMHFTARVLCAIPARVGTVRQVRLATTDALRKSRLELSLYSPAKVSISRPERFELGDDEDIMGIELAQAVSRESDDRAVEVWAHLTLNGECVHRRVWSF